MYQVEEVPPPPSTLAFNGSLLKSEMTEQPNPTPTPISVVESAVAPPVVTQIQPISVPIVTAQSVLTSTPSTGVKRAKRGFRTYLNTKKINRSLSKPATLLARPATVNRSTILPHASNPVVFNNSITPIFPKSVPTVQTTPSPGFTTYLVVDGNQGQLVQVANDGPKPVTFRNQSGQLLQATPISVVAAANQPVNGDCSLLSNSSQTITTVRTSSSIDMQQQTTLTSDTTTTTTQQFIHQPSILPTTILNGNNISTFENNSSLDEAQTSNSNLSLSLAQIAQKVGHRHRRSSSSSTSKKKRGRPRLYERDPFTNKPVKSDIPSTTTDLTIPTVTNTTLLIPGPTTTFNGNTCNSLIFPAQTATIPVANHPSLLQQHPYSYPSLLNGTTLNTTFGNNTNTVLSPTTFPYSTQPTTLPASSPQIPPTINTNVPNLVQLNTSPIKSSNNDNIAVHYLDGFVIRESNRPFTSNENSNHTEIQTQLRCIICQKLDLSQRFYDHERKFCSYLCSLKPTENQTPLIPQQPIESNLDEQMSLPPDHGLPADPSKWTVLQVGDFIARLTNETIRETFYESEMDGQALLLMTPEHLRETLKIKLGPSLVIASEIAKLQERVKKLST